MFAPDADSQIKITVSPCLRHSQPRLLPAIVDEITQAGEDYTIVHTHEDCLFKVVSWDGYEERMGILWMNAKEFLMFSNLGHLARVIAQYHKDHCLSIYSDSHLIIFNAGSLATAE
ncbi:hypothetical protein V5O48_017404 [Marasmius crinis-equi]|uniref:Uncharacterized protein n=1 Tax=Marasmius crinis-equi TaxID=585013 RepID=A0ABR3EPB0_9AGAR